MIRAIVWTRATWRRKSIRTGIGAGAPMLVLSLLPLLTGVARAQAQEQVSAASATIDSTIEAAEADAPRPPYDQKLIGWNDYKGESYTLHFGYNAMYDVVGYNQDAGSVDQWGDLKSPDSKWRDVRLLASGTFPRSKRILDWKVGRSEEHTSELQSRLDLV